VYREGEGGMLVVVVMAEGVEEGEGEHSLFLHVLIPFIKKYTY
jgi:hypothetical protein